MTIKNYYKVLQVEKTSSEEEIKLSYKRLARKYHPDVSQLPNATTLFQEISEAWMVLGDPIKKKKYDESFINRPKLDPFVYTNSSNFNINDINSVFDVLFKMYPNRTKYNYKEERIKEKIDTHYVNLSLEDILKDNIIKVPIYVVCSKCDGLGIIRLGNDYNYTKCDKCFGEKKINSNSSYKLKIPMGVEDGEKFQVGYYFKTEVIVKIKPHDVFKRYSNDLVFNKTKYDLECTIGITYPTACLGGEVLLSTLHGDIKIHIKKGIKNNTILKINNKVLNYPNLPYIGNLYCNVIIDIPTKFTDKQLMLLKELEETFDIGI